MDKVDIPEGSFGPWTVSKFEVPEHSIESLRLEMSGRGIEPGTYTKLVHNRHGLMMSDTRAEMLDHSWFVHRAKGDVLINGLGLGMCLNAILAKPEVTIVMVVEICQNLIDWVAPHYEDERLSVVCADALEYTPEKGRRFDAVWHDIWPTICSDHLSEVTKLKRKFGRRTDWQAAWCEDEMRRAA